MRCHILDYTDSSDYCCADCNIHEHKLLHAAEYMEGIYNILSGKDPVDLNELYDYLEEASAIVGYDMPAEALNITRR